MCTCMCVYCVCIHVLVCVCLYVFLRVFVCACVYVYVHAHFCLLHTTLCTKLYHTRMPPHALKGTPTTLTLPNIPAQVPATSFLGADGRRELLWESKDILLVSFIGDSPRRIRMNAGLSRIIFRVLIGGGIQRHLAGEFHW